MIRELKLLALSIAFATLSPGVGFIAGTVAFGCEEEAPIPAPYPFWRDEAERQRNTDNMRDDLREFQMIKLTEKQS
jgi:hypothetical protein